jgi:CrcB protein
VGGVFGTALRLWVGEVLGTGGFPWATLLVNVAGAAALGALLPKLLRGARSTRFTIPLLGFGLLGSFTTFSAFAVEIVVLADGGRAGTALAYLALSLAGGVAVALAAMRLAERAG